jgi:hypothetical protein
MSWSAWVKKTLRVDGRSRTVATETRTETRAHARSGPAPLLAKTRSRPHHALIPQVAYRGLDVIKRWAKLAFRRNVAQRS